LRKIIKKLVPDRGNIFFELFKEGGKNVYQSCDLLTKLMDVKYKNNLEILSTHLKMVENKSFNINKKILLQLEDQFITPIERSDIFYISLGLLRLTKNIVNISDKFLSYTSKLRYFFLKSNLKTLSGNIKTINFLIKTLKNRDKKQLDMKYQAFHNLCSYKYEEYSEIITKFRINSLDFLTIAQFKEFHDDFKVCVNNSITLCDKIICVYIKEI
jgi:hypothetical protein